MADPGVERRLAAILAADVVGYSLLMAADEEGTLGRLRALRADLIDPTIERHHGRIVKLMGDGALVEFASVVDAVRCAVDMQRGMVERDSDLPGDQRIRLRIGVNLGDVIIEGDDIYGDGVNVAARLEGLAEPGGIVISGTAFDHAKRAEAGFRYIGRQPVKNIPEPVRAYQVLLDPAAVGSVVDDEVPAAPARRRWPALAAAIALALIVGVALAWFRPWDRAEQIAPEAAAFDPHRIAVLPFVNISTDAENEYFADGVTEELITELSKIGELSVIARTSVMKFKDADKSIAEIGRELAVGTILEGSVRRAGDQVRITAQLVDVASEAHLWADDYDRDLVDIFAVQSSIAQEVAGNLKIELTYQDEHRIARTGTNSIEAYDLYLKALQAHDQGHVPAAVDMLEEAIALDSNYAEAYAAAADLYNILIWYADIAPNVAHQRAKEYADAALALNPRLARAHLARAMAVLYGDFDWKAAEQGFQYAISLNPSYARAHWIYAHFFLVVVTRQVDDALAEITRALELDPLAAAAWDSAAWVRHHREEPDEALATFRRAKQMSPDNTWEYIGIGQNLIFKGQYEEGIAEIKRAIELSPGYDFLLCYLAWGYGLAGKLDEAERVVAQLKTADEEKDISPMAFAWAYTGMGYKDQAIDWLNKAYEARDGAAIFVRVPEFYNVLSSEPRYHELLREMGLES